MDLRLEAGPQGHQLGPVPHELPELTDLRWRDPGLGQPPQAQQISQVGGVPLVVLDPPVAPVVPQRVGQINPPATLGQHISGPVPAVARLQDHVRVRSRLGHLQTQGHRIVLDPDHVKLLALRGHPHDHTPAPVQVNTDVLSLLLHGVPPPSRTVRCRNPECGCTRSVRAVRNPVLPRTRHAASHQLGARAHHQARHAEAASRSFITSSGQSPLALPAVVRRRSPRPPPDRDGPPETNHIPLHRGLSRSTTSRHPPSTPRGQRPKRSGVAAGTTPHEEGLDI